MGSRNRSNAFSWWLFFKEFIFFHKASKTLVPDVSVFGNFATGDHGHPTGATITTLSTDTGSVAPPMKAYVIYDPHHVQLDQLPTPISNLILK